MTSLDDAVWFGFKGSDLYNFDNAPFCDEYISVKTPFRILAEKTILSQYSCSPIITEMVYTVSTYLDPRLDLNTFYENIFDPTTAVGVGLDIWGDIVGIGRYLEVENTEYFGFFGSLLDGFDQNPFYQEIATNVYRMEDDAYRALIFYKAKANISGSTLPELKELINLLFAEEGHAIYVYNTQNGTPYGIMHINVVFTWYIDSKVMAILKNYGLLNVGAGVGVNILSVKPEETFGFLGSELLPFDQGIFPPFTVQDLNESDYLGFAGTGLKTLDHGVFPPN